MIDIRKAQDEVYDWAVSKGWEPDLCRSFDDECALLHSEVSEALEAYRDAGFEDRVDPLGGKPWGVGSALADVLIRVLHYSVVRGLAVFEDYVPPGSVLDRCVSFGAECTMMHKAISDAATCYNADYGEGAEGSLSLLYSLLLYSCKLHDFDLESEYRRKMEYNRTREYRHGGKAM